jgi:hypothetical protein
VRAFIGLHLQIEIVSFFSIRQRADKVLAFTPQNASARWRAWTKRLNPSVFSRDQSAYFFRETFLARAISWLTCDNANPTSLSNCVMLVPLCA